MAGGSEIIRDVIGATSERVAAERLAADGEQVDMFPLPIADPHEIAKPKIEAAAAAMRKGGRPPGAQNLSTRQWREYLLQRGIMPQQALMQMMAMGPFALAEVLGCSKLEAFREWRQLAGELGRYFMAPMVPVDDQGKAVPMMAVYVGGQTGIQAQDGTKLPPWAYLENQALSEVDATESQNEESQK